MPEYLAPGVYVEEVSFRAKSIEGVSTSTAGFVGPTRYGPIKGEPLLVTSYAEFTRFFGGLDLLEFPDEVTLDNYVAHAVRAFFDEGGSRLYISRVYRSRDDAELAVVNGIAQDGVASASLPNADADNKLVLTARFPGASGNVQVNVTVRVGQNALVGVPADPSNIASPLVPALRGVVDNDLVLVVDGVTDNNPGTPTLYRADRFFDTTTNQNTWRFWPASGNARALSDLNLTEDRVRVILLNAEAVYPGKDGRRESWLNLSLSPEHPRYIGRVFAEDLPSPSQAALVPFYFDADDLNGVQIANILFALPRAERDLPRLRRLLSAADNAAANTLTVLATIHRTELSDAERVLTFVLQGGNDGVRPEAGEYEGVSDPVDMSGLRAFENILDISIVAAPGATAGYLTNEDIAANADQITRHLITHCELMRYRIAVLEAADGMDIGLIREFRSKLDTTHAALYYPWIQILDPLTGERIYVPPAGSVAGIYARNDGQRGVHKAPANEVVRQAIGLEVLLNKAHQDVLNPEGINCFRFFEGRGYRLWGARNATSDQEWVYVNLRRYFAYLERSIERGTQWVVFEPNSEKLWADVRRMIESFLLSEWKSGHLMGTAAEQAFFVKCDRSTMTQNDIDTGRLICLIGVAPIRPAEFVIFRIGQWTGDKIS